MARRKIVLIVEDDRDIRRLPVMHCGALAISSARRRIAMRPSCCVRSTAPCNCDGFPHAGRRSISRLHTVAPHCPIIVMTAFGGRKVRDDVINAGASAYFEKPVRIPHVKAKVEDLLFKLI